MQEGDIPIPRDIMAAVYYATVHSPTSPGLLVRCHVYAYNTAAGVGESAWLLGGWVVKGVYWAPGEGESQGKGWARNTHDQRCHPTSWLASLDEIHGCHQVQTRSATMSYKANMKDYHGIIIPFSIKILRDTN